MFKLKTKTTIKNYDGQPIIGPNNEFAFVGEILASMLSTYPQNPANGWRLGKLIATEDEVQLKAEDVVFLKEAVENAVSGQKPTHTALVGGQIIELLDGIEEEKEVKKSKK